LHLTLAGVSDVKSEKSTDLMPVETHPNYTGYDRRSVSGDKHQEGIVECKDKHGSKGGGVDVMLR